MRVIDVEHLGRPHVIGCWEAEDGVLVDPGPESSLETVIEVDVGQEDGAWLLAVQRLDQRWQRRLRPWINQQPIYLPAADYVRTAEMHDVDDPHDRAAYDRRGGTRRCLH